MDEFKQSIKKIRRIFIIITLVYAIIAIASSLFFLGFSIVAIYNSEQLTNTQMISSTLVAGILFVVIAALRFLLVVGPLWGIFGIIYIVVKNNYSASTHKNRPMNQTQSANIENSNKPL